MLQLLQHALYTPHVGADASGKGPSSRIWSQIASHGTPDGAAPWAFMYDDFIGYYALAASGAVGGPVPYYYFMDTATSHGSLASLTDLGGVIRISTDDDADDAASMGPGHVGGMGRIAAGVPGTLTGTDGMMLFECRVKLPVVTDAVGGAFVGLSEVGKHADNGFITDVQALEDDDLIGFYVLDADGDLMNFGYNVTSGTAQVVGTTALTADTFVKLGFVYDPKAAASKRIKWYVNGAEQGTYVTAANVAATTFPAGMGLSPAICAKTDSGVSFAIDMDWWCCAYQRV